MMCLFLFFTGLGVGGEIAVAGTILNEFLPSNKSWALTMLCGAWGLGGALSALTAVIFSLTGTG